MWERIRSLLGLDREPRWKRRPEFYYACPECDGVAVNAKWRMRHYQTNTVLFEHRGVKHYDREMQYLCPRCDEWVPMDDVHSLDEIAYFEQNS